MTRAGRTLRLVAAAATLLASQGVTLAGGPLVTTTNGGAVGWDATHPVSYHTDRGPLGYLSNGAAVASVTALFDVWEAVPTAVIAFELGGSTPVDIDASNFGPYLGPYGGATSPLGQSVIAFDADGSIFDTLFGVGTGVLGFADPTFMSDGNTTVAIGDAVSPGAVIIEGLAFLNGKWIDGIDDPSNGNYELPLADFETVFVHEFGHFAGLDHTQIHGVDFSPDTDIPGPTQPVETMYPFIFDATQKTLERDDVASLSSLYPSAGFAASTGRITGRVLASNGSPISGVNVIARNVADDSDAVSYVSGATLVSPGAFSLAGLTPGASYRVEVQEIDAFATGGSRVGPFSPPVVMPGPPELYNGAGESADPAVDDPAAATPIVPVAGTTTSGIDVTLNFQRFTVTNVPLEGDGQLQDFAVGDFTGDDVPDFVAPQWGVVPGNLTRLYAGLGGGRFAAPVTIDSVPGAAHVVAGHYNPGVDGFLDFATVSALLEVRVYFGDGSGGFAVPVTLLDLPTDFNKWPVDLAAGDLNGDAYPDLVTLVQDLSDGSATVYAMLGSAAGTFTIVPTVLGPASPFPKRNLRLGRIAGSAATDVVGLSSGNELGVLVGDGAGGFTASSVSLADISNRLGSGIDVGDFDEDGVTDVALSDLGPVGGPPNWTRSFVDILRGDGGSGFALATRYPVPESFQDGLVAADIDADGHLDLASTDAHFGRGRPGAKVTVAHGNGAGGLAGIATIWGLAEFPTFLTAADLDGDGRPDLLVGSAASPQGLAAPPFYSVLLQNTCGDGTVQSPEQCDDGNRSPGDGCDGNCTPTACGNGIVSAGEQCDDGNTVGGDGCSAACVEEAVCGDGRLTAPEECDDGNTAAGDCCSPGCVLEPPGTPCGAEAGPCHARACDAAGACRRGARPPQTGCRTPVAGGTGAFALRNRDDDRRDELVWRWAKGAATPKAAFGEPATSTSYGLCVYDASATLLLAAAAPAAGTCGGEKAAPCWRETRTGFTYADPDLTPHGLRRIELEGGAEAGRPHISVRGKGALLDLPVLPIPDAALPLRVQLQATNGECWEAMYGALVKRNSAKQFAAKAD